MRTAAPASIASTVRLRTVDLLGLLALAVVVAAVVADEALLLFVALAVVALMVGAERR